MTTHLRSGGYVAIYLAAERPGVCDHCGAPIAPGDPAVVVGGNLLHRACWDSLEARP